MFRKFLIRVRDGEKGEILIEYGLIIALIAVVLIGILIAVNNGTTNYGNITKPIQDIRK